MKYVVVGFYTPNYKPLADRLRADLANYGAPSTFYPVTAGEWADTILLKPGIVRRARMDYPGATIVLMDVDCIVRGPIEPMLEFNGDIALYTRARHKRGSIRVNSSSRVIAFRPTARATQLVAVWSAQCRTSGGLNDEKCLMLAMSECPGLAVSQMDPRYAAREHDDAGPDAVIVHKSQHASTRPLARIRRWIKLRRRRAVSFVTGSPYARWKYGAAPVYPQRGEEH